MKTYYRIEYGIIVKRNWKNVPYNWHPTIKKAKIARLKDLKERIALYKAEMIDVKLIKEK